MNLLTDICNYFNVSLSQLRAYSKPTNLAQLRGIIYAYLRYETDLSTVEIGKMLNRTHSTIINVGNKYYYEMQKYDYLTTTYEAIRNIHEAGNINDE